MSGGTKKEQKKRTFLGFSKFSIIFSEEKNEISLKLFLFVYLLYTKPKLLFYFLCFSLFFFSSERMFFNSVTNVSSSSATVRVDKATSDLLMGPDWTMNIDICDAINSNQWQAKDVVKAVKRRLQHKHPRVQLLALTLLETMVKNCGDVVHFQIAERNILPEMVKMVKKNTDFQVKDKILGLLDSWQEAFGGPGGKHSQYYWAYEDLRRSGVQFPKRSPDAVPIFTPPVTHPSIGPPQPGYERPSNSTRRLDEAMASDVGSLSLSSLDAMQNALELLTDMLQAINPSDCGAVEDEIIVDLVTQCRANQKKLMQMLTSTGDEQLLARGLELNDNLQSVVAKHDAIAFGLPLPTQSTNFSPRATEFGASSLKPTDVGASGPRPNPNPSPPVTALARVQVDEEEEEEEDEFAQLARRHSKLRPTPSQSPSTVTSEGSISWDTSNISTSPAPAGSTPIPSNALALPDPPAPVKTTKEQDLIDLLSITLSTSSISPPTPQTPPSSNQNMQQVPMTQGYPYAPPHTYPANVSYSSYVVPWANPQPQPQPQPHSQQQPQYQQSPQPQYQQSPQPQYQQSTYPPPPWAATPGYYTNYQNPLPNNGIFTTPQANTSGSYMSMQGAKPFQSYNSFPSRGSNGTVALNGDPLMSSSPRSPAAASVKPFVPSYKLFEDLNVLGNGDGRHSTSPSMNGASGQGMVGGRK